MGYSLRPPEQEPPLAIAMLSKAAKHMEDRAAAYDKPQGERSMSNIVTAFNAITGHALSEADGWEFMSCVKQVRLFSNREVVHVDSYEDGIAYPALLAECCATKGLK